MGYYTNFMNLLDCAAVAVSSAFMSNGLPWGVTLFGRAFTDQYLLSVADALHSLLSRADHATYRTKQTGRNRTCVEKSHSSYDYSS
ncbi:MULTISPECIES: hypothetical protein [unclassified Pseudomonas]|uniref:hypothetical protein n=1 Tax=unclassified Pseudomonas TaxID=196821 RepID=UPI001CBC14A5|nr:MULTISPECIES: hypothetical protein [unclassified Pseudomonas]